MAAVALGNFAETYGWPWITAFIIMSIASLPLNFIIGKLFSLQMKRLATQIATTENEIRSHFDMNFAPIIGILERIVYIAGIMFGGAYVLISGWLVMKAFNAWLMTTELADPRTKGRMAYYHLYLYGNALSLIAGLVLGFIGLHLAAWPDWAAWLRMSWSRILGQI